MKISEALDKRLAEFPVLPDHTRPHPHTSVGIEVELEGLRKSDFNDLKRWRIVSDGSLHDGIEFVSDPVWGTAITDALNELDDQLRGKEPHLSPRTSIHVHINVLDMEMDALARFIKLYVMYEAPLFRLHEEWNRTTNIFCTPCHKSVKIMRSYSNIIKNLKRQHINRTDLPSKYCAMNTKCLTSLGTLEFRLMGGSVDIVKIDRWINILLQLKLAALEDRDINNPEEVWGPYFPTLEIVAEDIEQGKRMVDYLTLEGI
tara:strand:+ start:2961 stop:3737 length:777 start_codon:yes stop_codon:yes gene_type:complete